MRRQAKDAHTLPFCRQRLLFRTEHHKLEPGPQPHTHRQAPRGFCPDLGICFLGRQKWEDGHCGEGQGIGVHDEVEWKERHAESMENTRPGEAHPRNFNEKHHSESVAVDNQNLNVLTPVSQTLPHRGAFLKNKAPFHLTWHIPNLLPIRGAQKTKLIKDYVGSKNLWEYFISLGRDFFTLLLGTLSWDELDLPAGRQLILASPGQATAGVPQSAVYRAEVMEQ